MKLSYFNAKSERKEISMFCEYLDVMAYKNWARFKKILQSFKIRNVFVLFYQISASNSFHVYATWQ